MLNQDLLSGFYSRPKIKRVVVAAATSLELLYYSHATSKPLLCFQPKLPSHMLRPPRQDLSYPTTSFLEPIGESVQRHR